MSFLVAKRNYFALAFSDKVIKLVQLSKRGKVLVGISVKISSGIIEKGEIKNEGELANCLERVLKEKKIRLKYVAVSLPETKAFSRVIVLPFLPLEELGQAVNWQIEPLLPMSAEEMYLDWKLLEEKEEGIKVLVMALPKELVESYCHLLARFKIMPVAFEPLSLPLARLAGKTDKRIILAEVNEEETVSVILGPLGEIELSSTVSYSPGEKEKEFCATLKGMIDFYRKKESGGEVTKILLVGEAVNDSLIKSVKEIIKLEVELLKIEPLGLASTISLAKADVAAPIDESTINLLPPRIQGVYDREERKKGTLMWIKLTLFFVFLVFFIFSIFALNLYFESKRVEEKTLVANTSLPDQIRLVEERTKDVNNKSKKVVSLASSLDFKKLTSDINGALVEGVIIDHYSFDFDLKQVILNGVATSRRDLLAFRKNLEEKSKFKNIRIPLSSLEKEAEFSYSLSFNIP